MSAIPGPREARPAAVMKTNEQTTDDQVMLLLRTIGVLSSWVTCPFDDESHGHTLENPATRMAIETTIIKASNRLDEMFDDPKRWALPANDARELGYRYMRTQGDAKQLEVQQMVLAMTSAIPDDPAEPPKKPEDPPTSGAGEAVPKA